MSDSTDESLGLSESQKLRKRLPEIPPEELAKHGDVKISHDLPPEVQAQLKRRQFRSSSHKRSQSLSGIEGLELHEAAQCSQQTEEANNETRKENLMPNTVNNNVVSLPNTPVITRRSSDGGRSMSTESQDQEILKELRWHYKQYVKVSKRKKDKAIEVGTSSNNTDRVLSAVQVVLNEASSSTTINSNRCNRCCQQVEILERVAVENHVFHKACFVCAICSSWLNHFNYCFVPDHDKFYCIQHYQDIESASAGLDEQIRHALGIGPGVQQQFNYVPESAENKSKNADNKAVSKAQNCLNIMKEKISLLSKRGKKLEKKCKKLQKQIDAFKGSDLEKGRLWEEWFESKRDKNSTFRREAELTFRVRELELSEKYSELEKKLRTITEKTENTKTEYDKSNEKELLQEMLVVVEKREKLISEMESAKHRYAEEDKLLEKQKEEIGINQPDVVKDTTAADNEAKKVSQAVKQAPATIKKHSTFGCCSLL